MKIETKTQTIINNISTYVADDGKRFNELEDCLSYEAHQRSLEPIKNIPKLDINDLFNEHSILGAFYIKSKEEFKILYDYFNMNYYADRYPFFDGDMSNVYTIPDWYLIYEFDGGDNSNSKEIIPLHYYTENINKFLNQFPKTID